MNLTDGKYSTVNSNLDPQGLYRNMNGMGYNPLDNYLYAVGFKSSSGANVTYDVLRIQSTGDVKVISTIITTSRNGAFNIGEVDTNGQLFLSASGYEWAHVNVAPGTAGYGDLIAQGTATGRGNGTYADWVYLPSRASDYLYSVVTNSTSAPISGRLERWSTTSYVWESVQNNFTNYAFQGGQGSQYGASDGTLYSLDSTSGRITRFTPGFAPIFESTGPFPVTSADGARCVYAARPKT